MSRISTGQRRWETKWGDRGRVSPTRSPPFFQTFSGKMHFSRERSREKSIFPARKIDFTAGKMEEIIALKNTSLLCCPEDQICRSGDCVEQNFLCPHCKVPICVSCMLHLQANKIGPEMLTNDNWIGYIEAWIYEV